MTKRKQIQSMLSRKIYQHLKLVRGPIRATISSYISGSIDRRLEMILFCELNHGVFHAI